MSSKRKSGVDVIVANEGDLFGVLGTGEFNQLYTNDGSGNFTPTDLPPGVPGLTQTFTRVSGSPTTSSAVALADVDHDGDLDIFFVNHGGINPDDTSINTGESNVLLINNGDGTFTPKALDAPGSEGNGDAVAFGDVNGDGFLDALVAYDGEGRGQPIRVYIGDGTGNFTATDVEGTGVEGPAGGTSLRALDLALGDLDGDGDLDALVANDGDPNQVLINDGNGNFTAAYVQFFTDSTVDEFVDAPDTEGVALADLDLDGDLDGVFTNDGQGVQLAINERNNGGPPLEVPPPVDIDGDGTPDHPVIDDFFDLRIVEGTGGDEVTGNPGKSSKASAIGDFDGDGDFDIAVANTNLAHDVEEFNQLLINDGYGNFTAVDIGEPRRTENIVAGDIDGDGDLDLLISNATLPGEDPEPNQALINDGRGNFTAVDLTGPDLARVSRGLALGDVNGDGEDDPVDANGLPNINPYGLLPSVGMPNDANDLFVFTDEPSGCKTVTDTDDGIDTIAATTVTTGSVINLRACATSTIAGTSLKIGPDTIIENALGGFGDDTIIGNSEDNILVGNGGNDTVRGGDGDDRIFGRDGNDILKGGDDNDLLEGNQGDDKLEGQDGDDILEGGDGDDILKGGEGDDILEGGAGNDLLKGGEGDDTFVFKPDFGNDRITGFDANPSGGQDSIDLSGFGITAADFADRVEITDVGADTLVTIDGDANQTIRLAGIGNSSKITVDDFLIL
jgi:Ca2+-binding RTX toxin-like protein